MKAVMKTQATSTPTVGYIQFVFFDDAINETIILGGAGFDTPENDATAWDAVPQFAGTTSFQADRMDAICDITNDRPVSAETCEHFLGKPIAILINEGRKALAEELASAMA